MTAAEAQNLKPGDIVEFRGDACYWLGKLVKVKTDPKTGEVFWEVKNNGRHGGNGFGTKILTYPQYFALVGHSDYP